MNGPEDTNPASPGPGAPDAAPWPGVVGLQATLPAPGPWAATPELGPEQSLAQVLALMEAVSLRVRPLQMPHPQKFRQQAPAGRLLTEIVHILPGQTNAFICCSQELPRALVSAWSRVRSWPCICPVTLVASEGGPPMTGPPLDSRDSKGKSKSRRPVLSPRWPLGGCLRLGQEFPRRVPRRHTLPPASERGPLCRGEGTVREEGLPAWF